MFFSLLIDQLSYVIDTELHYRPTQWRRISTASI